MPERDSASRLVLYHPPLWREEKALHRRAFFSSVAMKRKFEKKAENSKVLVAKMEARGLVLDGDGRPALFEAFKQIGYYRFTGFCLPFQKSKPKNSNFVEGTTVQQVLRLYDFDTELRALCGKALEKLEVSVRVAICDHMARAHADPHWYTDMKHYSNQKAYGSSIVKAAGYVEFDLDTGDCYPQDGPGRLPKFLEHYYNNYNRPAMPPCWMLSEVASFGFWSILYRGLSQQDKKQVADRWTFPDKQKIQPTLFSDWLWSISIFRNRCAHHARITYRTFPFEPAEPRENKCKALFKRDRSDLSSLLLVIALLLRSSAPRYRWSDDLRALFEKYSDVDLVAATGLGSVDGDWKNDALWSIDEPAGASGAAKLAVAGG